MLMMLRDNPYSKVLFLDAKDVSLDANDVKGQSLQ
jgi:hypothetical protein